MSKKMLTIVFTLLIAPQLICANTNEKQLTDKEVQANINASLAQAQKEAFLRNKLLLRAARKNNPREVKALLALGADINTTDENNKTPLYLASQQGNEEIVNILLSYKEIKVDTKDKKGFTPLMIASSKGYLNIVKALVNKGANVNSKTKDGFTPLLLAVWKAKNITATYLINNTKADLNAVIIYGQTPLLLCAYDNPHYYDLDRDIGKWVSADRTSIAKALIAKGVNINAKNDSGETALIIAARSNKLSIMSELFKNANLDVKAKTNDTGNTALHYAKNIIVIQKLVQKGADVNAHNNYNTTPLMYACQRGDISLVKNLLSLGARINDKNDGGDNALSYALHSDDCNPELIKLLMDKGVSTNIVDAYGRTIKDLLTKPYDDVFCDGSVLDIVFPKQ